MLHRPLSGSRNPSGVEELLSSGIRYSKMYSVVVYFVREV
jgi:hypothetical protein